MLTPYYDPTKPYEENFKEGPFGAFADGQIYKDLSQPNYELLGQKLYSLFGIPAGPLVNGRFVKAALDKGFDICTYKTVRSGESPCHPWPNVVALDLPGNLALERAEEGIKVKDEYGDPLSITNSFGVPSFDPDFWQEDMKLAVEHAKAGQVVVGSFQGTSKGDGNMGNYVKDFVLTARLVKEAGAKFLEVNLSCPNEGSAHLLCFDLETTRKVAEAVKNEIGNTPLIIKIAYFENQNQLKALVGAVGGMVEGIQAINTIPAKILNKKGKQFFKENNRIKSGVCGHAIKWAGLDMVKRLNALREELSLDYTVTGVGGVVSADDYQEYIGVGADAVMSATGSMWNPFLAQEIKKEIL